MPAFDRRMSDFEAANTQVLGISTDSPFSHENWAKSVGISRYPLLADLHRTAAKDYGVYWPEWNANLRATFIVDPDGIVRFVERYGRGQLPDPDRLGQQRTRQHDADDRRDVHEDGGAAGPHALHGPIPPDVRHRAEER